MVCCKVDILFLHKSRTNGNACEFDFAVEKLREKKSKRKG